MHKLLKILKALSDETRFNIINLLLRNNYCVKALAERLKISEAAVSQHLKVLRMAGLVKGEKRGYWTHYSVDRDVIEKACDELKQIVLEPVKNNCKKDCLIKKQSCRKE